MILCLDSGNTRLKWGVHDGLSWLASGALLQAEVGQLAAVVARWPDWQRLVIANVAGEAALQRIRDALGGLGERLEVVGSSGAAAGVVNRYRIPEKLGVDRWCALIGARSLSSHATLVVMAGTATTVDTLDGQGNFLGGLILPGVELMRQSLGRGTAQLPIAAGEHRPYPDCTEDAIHSGILEAQAGAVERAYARLAGAKSDCLIGGGNAHLLSAVLNIPHRCVENLPLEGLKEIAKFP